MGEKMLSRLFEKNNGKILRGELWISGEVLKELGFEQTQDSIIPLSAKIGANICFFNYTSPIQKLLLNSGELDILVGKAHDAGLACGVTVDGPFERLVKEHGFMEVMGWFQNKIRLQEGLRKCTFQAAEELAAAEEAGADLLMLCDDIAYKRGLYFSPDQFDAVFLPFYRQLRNSVSSRSLLGFHSDGNIESIITKLSTEGYSLFSLEPEAVDLIKLSGILPENLIILSGIKADWLMGPDFGEREKNEARQYITSLKGGCSIILASSCGITDKRSLARLGQIYKLAG